ncbi:MAG: CarD family transcriptional regulator [Clostridium sp.]
MFNKGDLVIYSSHGICRVDDICELDVYGSTKTYYILHPVEDKRLQISTPIDNAKVVMLELLDKIEAEEVIDSFKSNGVEWAEFCSSRQEIHSNILTTGNRKYICSLLNTLMRREKEFHGQGRKFNEKDAKLLKYIKNILFTEIAMALNTTFEDVSTKVSSLIYE